MAEKLKEIPEKLLEFWNKYSTKHKAIFLSIIACVLIAMGILVFVLTRTSYTHLITLADETSVTQLRELLESEKIAYKTSKKSNGYEITVDEKKATDAMILMGNDEIVDTQDGSDMDWETALKNSIDTTEGEKNKKYTLAYQNDLRTFIKKMDGVEDAWVSVNAPEDDGTIFAENQDTSVAVMLDLKDDMTTADSTKIAQSLANYLKTSVGNQDTSKITIVDSNSNLLFDGSSADTLSGNASSTAEFQETLRAVIKNDLKQMLLKNNYNEVEIGASNLQFNMDQVSSLYTEFSTPEGQEQGPYSSSYEYASNGNSGSAGIPGTDSNSNDTDYMLQNGSGSETSTTLNKYEYDVNKKETTRVEAVGALKAADSSIAIVLKRYTVYDEERMQKNGELEGTDFDTFQSENNEAKVETVDDTVIDLIAKATGISEANISVIAYNQPIFNEAEKQPVEYANYIMIILAVLIVALLIFVIFKGTAPIEVIELEPELSVEQLLATTKENQSLEDIEFGEKSETRRMIEKFVDENPEAVAQLLRNWINDDWG